MERETKTPQIAFTDGITWSVIWPYASLSGFWERYPLPQVDCPLVDTRGADQKKLDLLLARRSSPAGFADVPKLIRVLEKIGCEISYPVKVEVCAEQSVS